MYLHKNFLLLANSMVITSLFCYFIMGSAMSTDSSTSRLSYGVSFLKNLKKALKVTQDTTLRTYQVDCRLTEKEGRVTTDLFKLKLQAKLNEQKYAAIVKSIKISCSPQHKNIVTDIIDAAVGDEGAPHNHKISIEHDSSIPPNVITATIIVEVTDKFNNKKSNL